MTNSTREALRREMTVTETWAYFDHAAVAPTPRCTANVMTECLADQRDNGAVNWTHWRNRIEDTRRTAATMLNASTDEVAIIRNTTEGIGLIAEGLPWQPGDNVVVPGNEFPSNLYPWLNLESRGVEVRVVPADHGPLDLNSIDNACDEKTRVVSISWIDYASGWRNDPGELASMAHRHGALLFLDMIQGFGVFPLDVQATGVDFAAADGHKWMLGPEGAGVLYIRAEHLNQLRPLGVGWQSVVQAGDFTDKSFNIKPSADRYEGGTHNLIGSVGLGESLSLLSKLEVENVRDSILQIGEHLCESLLARGATVHSERSPTRSSGILSVDIPGSTPSECVRRAKRAGVAINHRNNHVRISAHAYNDETDVERLLAALFDS